MRKSLFLIILFVFGALPVVAQSAGPTKNIWDYIVDGYNGLAMTFDDMSTKGLESAKFLMFIRVLLLIAVFTLFFDLIGKNVFKDAKDKNKNIVISLALAIIAVVAMPNAALVGIASLYSGALVFILVGALVIGAMYWTLYGLKGETRGTYFTKALMFAILMWVTSTYSNAAYFISQPPSMLFTNMAVLLSLVLTVLMIWFAVKSILMPAGGPDIHETVASTQRVIDQFQGKAILSTVEFDRSVRKVNGLKASLLASSIRDFKAVPQPLMHALDELNTAIAQLIAQKSNLQNEGQRVMQIVSAAQGNLSLLDAQLMISSAKKMSDLRQEKVAGTSPPNMSVVDLAKMIHGQITTALSAAAGIKALAQMP